MSGSSKRKLSSPVPLSPDTDNQASKCSRQPIEYSVANENRMENVSHVALDCADWASDFDEEWSFSNEDEVFNLNLSNWQRCKVVAVERCLDRNLLVTLEEIRGKDKAKCVLAHPWNALEHIEPGITVSVLAVKSEGNHTQYTVDCKNGFFVTNPDLLISGTTVVGSLFCARRGVLQEIFRMIDTDNQQMHVGTLAHAIFQECLTDDNCRKLEDVRRISGKLLLSKEMIATLFAYKMSSEEALNLMDPYMVKIAEFLENHVSKKKTHTSSAVNRCKKNMEEQLTIHKINDIEENIWCHQLGIKGKIDATVTVGYDKPGPDGVIEQFYEVMPLEIKTGRASYSFEHSGQLALYEMMMNLVRHGVNSGLLVYLRENKVSKIAGNRNTKRDLIMLRNEIAHYIGKWMVQNESERYPLLPDLPEPKNDQRVCSNCSYNTLCIVMAKKQHKESVMTNGLLLIENDACGHLTNHDIDYIILWTGLIYLEREECAKDYSIRSLWTKKPEERVQRGWCVAGLHLLGPARKVNGSYYHSFRVDRTANLVNTEKSGKVACQPQDDGKHEAKALFEVGEYVVCSTSTRIAIAIGCIQSIVGHEIIASFERNLSINYNGETFILDRGEPYKSGGFNLTNLAMLLRNTPEAKQLRRIIIDREIPTFKTHNLFTKSMKPVVKKMLEQLNHDQKKAILEAASTTSYCLLKGLPGTGKTETIVGLIRLLSMLGLSVLLTSNTHSAVDNVLKRLAQCGEPKFIRLGSIDRIDPAIRAFSSTELSEHCSTSDELMAMYQQYNIVAVTCQGTSHPLINQRMFDYCIVDEATQVFQSSIIRPLMRSKRFLLVGDPEQLPPVIKSSKARSLGAAESLFHRLDQEGCVIVLPTQYRMNRVLTRLANDLTYNGKLVCGNDLVANATLLIPKLDILRQMYEVERWLMLTVSNRIHDSVVAIDTGNTYQLNTANRMLYNGHETEDSGRSRNYCNISEVALVVYVCAAMLRVGVPGTSIGVIAPFRAQVDLIRHYMKKLLQKQQVLRRPLSTTQSPEVFAENQHESAFDGCSIEVNTVDQFQGKDKKLMIYSCTRSSNPCTGAQVKDEQSVDNANEILNDKRRLTVAITRAKEKLILLGDWTSMDPYQPFKSLRKAINDANHIKLEDKQNGFEWQNIFDALNLLND